MRVLIIGGTGPIGGHAALHLANEGHEVVISSRNPPVSGTGLEDLNWVKGDYLADSFTQDDLSRFDAIVFAAGSDMRHVPQGVDADAHYLHANGEKVPAFAKMAKAAGVRTFIHIGSFYPQVVPEQIETNAYVRSRHLADTSVCGLSDNTFRAMSLNAPFVVGCPAGMKNEMFTAYIGYARGLYPNIRPFGPAGGTNFISVQSLSEAIAGALENGEGGKSYLLGDENLSFADYFKVFFRAVGNPAEVPAIDAEHPMLPDYAILTGRGNTVSYEPDASDVTLLGYRRADITPTVEAMVRDLDAQLGEIEPVKLSSAAAPDPDLMRIASLYARAMDRNEPDLLDTILAEDVIVEGPGFKMQGLAEARTIPAMLQQFYRKTHHAVYQQLCEISGDTAIGEAYSTATHILFPQDGRPDEVLTWQIRYQDRFVRLGGEWRLKRRSLIVDWMDVRSVSLPL